MLKNVYKWQYSLDFYQFKPWLQHTETEKPTYLALHLPHTINYYAHCTYNNYFLFPQKSTGFLPVLLYYNIGTYYRLSEQAFNNILTKVVLLTRTNVIRVTIYNPFNSLALKNAVLKFLMWICLTKKRVLLWAFFIHPTFCCHGYQYIPTHT